MISVLALLALAGCSGSGTRPPSPAASTPQALSLVVIGDSIPYNSSDDCPGCTGFVDQYADALTQATGRRVETTNLSQHTGLTLPELLAELDGFREQLSSADAIIVGVAHNSIALGGDEPCGTTFDETTSSLADWSKVDLECAVSTAEEFRPKFERLYSQIAGWRAGSPTILRTINKYNDWIGWQDAHLSRSQQKRTVLVHDAWDEMLCAAAESNQFACADIYHAFNGSDGSQPANDLLAGDYTHPSGKGNALIARVLAGHGFAPLA